MNNAALLIDLLTQMRRIRAFELAAGELMEKALIPGSVHLSVGQEAVAAGVCAVLRQDDQITSTHRGHGHMLAKGGSIAPMIAELFGRRSGSCGGKGGSMHISDPSIGALGANGIVGAGPPIAVGAAFANRFKGADRVAVAFFGDGASNEGSVHEAGNMAAVWNLPVLFVCENNGYAEFTPQAHHQRIRDIADVAGAWGMDAVIVDGMDVMAVYEAARAAVEKARKGGGPTFIEAKTYRFYDHIGFKGLRLKYRPPEEVAAWEARDPIKAVERALAEAGALSAQGADAIRQRFEDEVAAAIDVARSAEPPEPGALLRDVYTLSEAS
ncbi:MAG: thiamine pyrophosphate-dependent dehydrogenase E1 component subunit alpha [Phenylobacterium sp.]|nr:thiamine pyrophosphate-dependent dehydrogenase E1 component subunit alpha [Phenylobacterium sp.]